MSDGPRPDRLRALLLDRDLRAVLGDGWLAREQERIAEEATGEAPAARIAAPRSDADERRRIRREIITTGALSAASRRRLRGLARAGARNPAYVAWCAERTRLLGRKRRLGGQSVWIGGTVEPLDVAERLAEGVLVEVEQRRQERIADAEVRRDLEHLDERSASDGWIELPDGRVVFVAPEPVPDRVFDVSALKTSLAREELSAGNVTIGYRFWKQDERLRLCSPFRMGGWEAGLSEAPEWESSRSAGFYAVPHESRNSTHYFRLRSGTSYEGERVMIAAVAMWNTNEWVGAEIHSQWAAPAAFLLLDDDPPEWRERVSRTARLYGASIADADGLHAAARAWAEEHLGASREPIDPEERPTRLEPVEASVH